ncbi:hypothetical protein MTO96_038083 [Rhipicephalus appendiculatus]
MMEKKKVNFSEEERAVLLDLLSRHRSVVENKRTDAASASRKRDSWEKIEDEFNSRHNVTPRKWTQLKKCWENMKDKWRRTNAEDMRERFASGEGTPPSSEMTDELQRVGDIASQMAVRLPNPCDSDRSRHDAMPGGIAVLEPAVHTFCRCTAVADTRQASGRVRWYGSFAFFSLPMF